MKHLFRELWDFFFPVLANPDGSLPQAAASLLSLTALVLLGLLCAGQRHDALLGAVLALTVLEKAVLAWAKQKDVQK